MTNVYEEDLIDETDVCGEESEVEVDDMDVLSADDSESDGDGLDARRRLENLLEERRLRDELDDYSD